MSESDGDEEEKDTFIKITSAEITDTIPSQGKLRYKIVTGNGDQQWECDKRYSEIREFWEKLKSRFPSVELRFPPKVIYKSKVNMDLRKEGLQEFLNNVVDHARLSISEETNEFLIRNCEAKPSNLTNNLTDSFQNLSKLRNEDERPSDKSDKQPDTPPVITSDFTECLTFTEQEGDTKENVDSPEVSRRNLPSLSNDVLNGYNDSKETYTPQGASNEKSADETYGNTPGNIIKAVEELLRETRERENEHLREIKEIKENLKNLENTINRHKGPYMVRTNIHAGNLQMSNDGTNVINQRANRNSSDDTEATGEVPENQAPSTSTPKNTENAAAAGSETVPEQESGLSGVNPIQEEGPESEQKQEQTTVTCPVPNREDTAIQTDTVGRKEDKKKRKKCIIQ